MKVKAYVVLALLICVNNASASGLRPYDESADPKNELVTAMAEARSSGKKVLVTFGSNWCSDCQSFDQQLQKEPLKSLINKEFIVIKADIGNWDKNMDFADKFSNPEKEGIPAIAVVDSNQEQYYITRGRELARARHQSISRLTDWFTLIADKAPEKITLKDKFQ